MEITSELPPAANSGQQAIHKSGTIPKQRSSRTKFILFLSLAGVLCLVATLLALCFTLWLPSRDKPHPRPPDPLSETAPPEPPQPPGQPPRPLPPLPLRLRKPEGHPHPPEPPHPLRKRVPFKKPIFDNRPTGGVQPVPTDSRVISLTQNTPPPQRLNQLYYLDGYNVEVIIHGPDGTSYFTPLYDDHPRMNFCLVDAGTTNLGINGGGINGALVKLLVQQSHGKLTEALLNEETVMIHTQAANSAYANQERLQKIGLNPGHRLYSELYSYYANNGNDLRLSGQNVAVVIIGILQPALYIYGDARNRFLLYTVAPRGNAPNFEVAYSQTYTNIMEAVRLFNKQQTTANKIEQLRLPLLAGGIYAGNRKPKDIAKLAAQVLVELVADAPLELPLLDLMCDKANSWFFGFRALLTDKTA